MLVPDCPAAAPTSSIWDEAVTQLIGGTPPWFPYGVPIVSTWQIPLRRNVANQDGTPRRHSRVRAPGKMVLSLRPPG